MAISSAADQDEVLSEINITPLVDVMLVLLVAFIVTAPLLNNAVKVNLPKTAATQPPEQKAPPVTVSVDASGKVYIDRDEIAQPQLEGALRSRVAANPDLVLHLSSDESVAYGNVARVMASIERAGVTKLAVLTATGE
jgi:biopolymer transport protein ExbD/biopolymer transport protein TolR